MAWKLNSRHERAMSEINITPLTDVMLVLLVIFMVTTPLIMTSSLKVKLPRAVSSSGEPGRGVTIAVSETGAISVNSRMVSADGLAQGLRQEFGKGADKTVVIRADGNVRHSVIVKVLDASRIAGAEKLSIATEQDKRN